MSELTPQSADNPANAAQSKLAALLAGIVFGAGLVISGMTDPNKVIAFLTLNNQWDPSLIFVMGSALLVTGTGYALIQKRRAPLFDARFHPPTASVIDQRLIGGAVLFGVGWALSGFCPGPAIVGTFTFDLRAAVFLAAYLAGVGLFELTRARTAVVMADG